jgi:hypothetical protein
MRWGISGGLAVRRGYGRRGLPSIVTGCVLVGGLLAGPASAASRQWTAKTTAMST